MLVIGAGEAGRLVAKVAKDRGISQIIIASRNKERASDLAVGLGGKLVSLSNLMEELSTANIVVTCSAAPHRILSVRQVEEAMRKRPQVPAVIIDIAVPRNVEPAVRQIKNVFFKTNKMYMSDEIEFAILVPLIVENEAIGAVVSFLPRSSFEFLKKDVRLLEALRGQASIALGSAVQSELAVLDRLTKIYNHAYFETRLEQEIARSDRYKYPVSLLMVDIDHFKQINDTYGHQQGDTLLKEVARVIKSSIRVVDLCARYGGEEFAVILPETELTTTSQRGDPKKLEESGGAVAKAENLRRLIEKTELTSADGSRISVTASIGIGVKKFPEGSEITKDGLIKEADKQLYKAKQAGRNKVCYP